MPLTQGCSEEAVEANIEKLVEEGRSREQAVAIAYSIAYHNIEKCGRERQQELRQQRHNAES